MTVDQQPRPSGAGDAEALTATILTAVERQLTRYFSAMSQQADAARQAAEQARDELRNELMTRFATLEAALDAQRAADDAQREALAAQRQANEAYQAALQAALEERLSEFANHQHWRMSDLEDKLAALPTGLDPETMMEVRQTVRDDMERSFSAINGRIDDLAATDRRIEEQGSSLAQQFADATIALTTRMDEGDARSVQAVDDRIGALQEDLGATFAAIESQVVEHANTMLAKLDASETRATDRLLELEARINEEQGTKIANLEATIGRIGGGFDDAMIAMNQRLLALENRLYELDDRIGEMGERVSKVDETALDAVRAEMSHAIGEATLVRIELDRVVAATDEKIDKQTIRMAEIEGLLADQMDVSTAVQLERLDELERQMQMLEPTQFSRRDTGATTGETGDYAAGGSGAGDRTPANGTSRSMPSMSLNPRPSGADTGQHEQTVDTEPTYSAH